MALTIIDHFTIIFIIKIGLVAYSYSLPKRVLGKETTTETFFGHSSSPELQSTFSTQSSSDAGYGTVSTVDGSEISERIFTLNSEAKLKTHQLTAENDQTSKLVTFSTKTVTPAAKSTQKPAVAIIGGMGDQFDKNIIAQLNFDIDDAFLKQVTPFPSTLFPSTFSSSSSYRSTMLSSTYGMNGIKCTSFEIYLTIGKQYCIDTFGNRYLITSPSPSTEQVYDEIYIHHDSNDSKRLIDIQHDRLLKMFCPNLVYCPEERKQVNLSNHCCIPCDCSNTCIDSGTCCLYKGHTESHRGQTEPIIRSTSSKNEFNIDEQDETTTYENRTKRDELAESVIKNSIIKDEQEITIDPNYRNRAAVSNTDLAFAENQGGKSRFHERCVETFVGNDSVDIEIQTTHSYMLIQSCPEDGDIDKDARDKCIRSSETELSDSIPFYSSRTKNSYRNIHCAKCNNDSLFGKLWDSYFTCLSEITTVPLTRSVETVDDISPVLRRMNKCIVFWKPDTNTARYCVNRDRLISTCKGKELASLCLQNYAPVRGRKGIYRNLYCLFCNEESTKLVCDNKESGTELFVTKLPIGDSFLKAETDERIGESETEGDETCERGLVYDQALTECIQKRCAVTQMQIGGKCVSVLDHISGISLDYRFAVSFPSAHLPTEDLILEYVRMLSLIQGDERNCLERVLGAEEKDDRVSVHIRLVKRVKAIRDIRIDFSAFREKISQLNSRMLEEKAPIEVEVTKTPLHAVDVNFMSFLSFNNTSNDVGCGREVAMSELQFCETVLLQNVTFIPDGTVVHSGSVAFAPGEYVAFTGDEEIGKSSPKNETANSVLVCYDMYVLRMHQSRGRVPFNSIQNTGVSSGVISRLVSGTLLCLYVQITIELLIIHVYRQVLET